MDKDKKICEWCEEEFIPKRKDSRYCQRDHFKNCENCGQPYLIKSMKRPGKSCSKKCSDSLTTQNRGIELVCEECHQPFIGGKKTDRFCQRTHYRNCVICRKNFELYSVHHPSSTCSPRCAATLIDFTERNAKSTATTRERYGVDNVSQAQEIKDKKRETTMKHYGVNNPSLSPQIQAIRESTFLEKYGVTNPTLNSDIKNKQKATNLQRYGSENPFGNKEVQQKVADTIRRRYGVDNILQLPENREKALRNGRRTVSKINHSWRDCFVKELGVEVGFEKAFGSYSADLYLNDNLLVDINPTITHNSTIPFSHAVGYCKNENCSTCRPIDPTYHQSRALAAMSEGRKLLQFFDWYNADIFMDVVRSKAHLDQYRIGARQTELRKIPQSVANRFLKENHLSGPSTGQTLCYGLYYKNELVHVQTYGPARMNKNIQWEAIRSSTKRNWAVQGGFSKCDKHFMKSENPDSIVSYVDLGISDGSLETRFDGWKLHRTNRPSSTWVNLLNNDNPAFIKDSTARRISADRLLGFEVGDRYPRETPEGNLITNDFVLLSEGYVQVYDAGTRTFVWKK